MSTSTESGVSTLKRMAGKIWGNVLAPAIVIAIPVMIIVICIISGTDLPWRSSDFGGEGSAASGKPAEKSQDEIDKEGAKNSQNGQALTQGGYSGPLTAVQYQPLVDFLNKQLNNTGTYMQFTRNTTGELPERYDDPDTIQAEPDVILDSKSGLMVALSKNYSTGRGLTCYTPEDPRNLGTETFNKISAQIWNKSLDQIYTHAEADSIPVGVTCFAQSS